MPHLADQPTNPLRTWRPMVLWSAGLLLVFGHGCFEGGGRLAPQPSEQRPRKRAIGFFGAGLVTGRLSVRESMSASLGGREIEDPASREADFWFQAVTPTDRFLTPRNGARMALVPREPSGPEDIAEVLAAAGASAEKPIPVDRLKVGSIWVCARDHRGWYRSFTLMEPVGPSPATLMLSLTVWSYGEDRRLAGAGRFSVREPALVDLDRGREVVAAEADQADFGYETDDAGNSCLTPRNGVPMAVVALRPTHPKACAQALTAARERAGKPIAISSLEPLKSWVCLRTSEGRYAAFCVSESLGADPHTLEVLYDSWRRTAAVPPKTAKAAEALIRRYTECWSRQDLDGCMGSLLEMNQAYGRDRESFRKKLAEDFERMRGEPSPPRLTVQVLDVRAQEQGTLLVGVRHTLKRGRETVPEPEVVWYQLGPCRRGWTIMRIGRCLVGPQGLAATEAVPEALQKIRGQEPPK